MTVLDSGFHIVDSGFQVLDFSLCSWNLDARFQSLMGFWIPTSRISDSISKLFPESGFPYMGRHKQGQNTTLRKFCALPVKRIRVLDAFFSLFSRHKLNFKRFFHFTFQ